MAGAFRHPWLRAIGATLALAAVSAAAEAQTAGQAGPLRGYQIPDRPAPKALPTPPPPLPTTPGFDPGIGPPPLADLSPIPRFQDDPAPRFNLDPAPRILGLDQRGGGAACRTSCAESRYQCRATDESDVCDAAWSQCVASCGESSPSPP
jgi:hypothetical protein